MIALITTCDPQRFNLLRPFVAHYRAYGVEQFFINLHFDVSYPQEQHEQHIEAARLILTNMGLDLHSIYMGTFDAALVRRQHDAIQSSIAERFRWLIAADLDEFHEFPDHLTAVLPFLDSRGVDCVRGKFVDRMAREGFPELRAEQSLWQQFPLGTDMTRAILRGCIDKVVMHRSRVPLIPGHHGVRAGFSARVWSEICAVHHFKWDSTVVVRLRRRLEEDWRQRCPWWTQSDRALNWLGDQVGDAVFPGLRVFDFEDDHAADGGGPLGRNGRYSSARCKLTSGAI